MLLLGLFVLLLHGAGADVPANCSNTEAVGIWALHLGPGGFDNTLDCSYFRKDDSVAMLYVTLENPDIAIDENHNTGFWTFVDNQGFEVQVNRAKYFAFANSTTLPNGTVISECSSTLPGWYHDDDGTNWGCYVGVQVLRPPRTPKHNTIGQSTGQVSDSRVFQDDEAFVDQVNSENRTWQATVYTQFIGRSMDSIVRMSGGSTPRAFPDPVVHVSPTDTRRITCRLFVRW